MCIKPKKENSQAANGNNKMNTIKRKKENQLKGYASFFIFYIKAFF